MLLECSLSSHHTWGNFACSNKFMDIAGRVPGLKNKTSHKPTATPTWGSENWRGKLISLSKFLYELRAPFQCDYNLYTCSKI